MAFSHLSGLAVRDELELGLFISISVNKFGQVLRFSIELNYNQYLNVLA